MFFYFEKSCNFSVLLAVGNLSMSHENEKYGISIPV